MDTRHRGNGRHMAQTAAHLVDHVIPPVTVRQWVISVPKRLRGFLAERPANRSSRLPSLPPAARPPTGASSRSRTTIGRSFKRRPTSCPRSTSTASERCRTRGIKAPDGRPVRRSAPRREKRHSGGSAGVPGPAAWLPENAAPASPAAHRLGNACRHGCGSAIDRTSLRRVATSG